MKRIWIASFIAMTVTVGAMAKQPKNYYADQAKEAIDNLEFAQAMADACQEIAEYGKNPRGYLYAAEALFYSNTPESAVPLVDKALKLSKNDREVFEEAVSLKRSLTPMGDLEKNYLPYLETAMKLFPDQPMYQSEYIDLIADTKPDVALRMIEEMKKASSRDC